MAWYRTGAGNGGGGADYVELTQSQYDQLSDAEKKNGKLYFITDANGDGSQFQPVIYSETEREIGVWLNGKPLYAKTFNKSVTCGSEQTTIDTNDIPNLDAIVYAEGYYAAASLNYYDSANYRSYTFAENSNHRLISFVKFGSTASVNSRITLYYTKTTDAPGSGTWTPQGVPAHHYSTTEHVVGTWIDGSTLYEIVLETDTQVQLVNADWTTIPWNNEPADINFLVSAEIVRQCPNTNATMRFSLEDGHIKGASLVNTNYPVLSGLTERLIIRYTKSSS